MRVRILGSAAGGGFPQWNCLCANCRGLRAGTLRAKARSQCSIAVTGDDGKSARKTSRWLLLNASPDLRAQLASFPELLPSIGPVGSCLAGGAAPARGTSIASVIITDAELDHVAGLLSLRESEPLELHCTSRVYEWLFKANPVFGGLIEASRFRWVEVEPRRPTECREVGVSWQAVVVEGKVPTYIKTAFDGFGSTIGSILNHGKASMLYLPVVRNITEEVVDLASKCGLILFDGSFWSDDEMARRGVGTRTALAMGHVPIDGPAGSLARLSHLRARKVYTHINNTNPILDEDSPERRAVEAAGWEVAEDGMDIVL